MYDTLKYFGKGTEIRGWSVIIPQDSLSFFENEYNGFQTVGKVRCGNLSLKINLRTGIKISE